MRDRNLAVRGRDSPWMTKTWPRLHQNKALEVCFIMVPAVFSGGMGNQGSQAPHGFSAEITTVHCGHSVSDIKTADLLEACEHLDCLGGLPDRRAPQHTLWLEARPCRAQPRRLQKKPA